MRRDGVQRGQNVRGAAIAYQHAPAAIAALSLATSRPAGSRHAKPGAEGPARCGQGRRALAGSVRDQERAIATATFDRRLASG
jgi:hypothetical protein